MSIRWCYVAQTTQEKDISRRDAKAQRRREREEMRTGNIEQSSFFLCVSASLREHLLAALRAGGSDAWRFPGMLTKAAGCLAEYRRRCGCFLPAGKPAIPVRAAHSKA
jgi:hypothetical protein